MEHQARHQEILLITSSTLSRKTFSEKIPGGCRPLKTVEQLEEFCCNGRLETFMPHLMETEVDGSKLLLWHIQQAGSFLHIDLCERPGFACEEYSIDPYFFLSYNNMN